MSRPKRIFLQSIAWVVLLNLIVKPLYIFGIDRTVQNTVGPEEYGLYYALFNLTFLFQILLDLGLTNYHNKSVSQREGHLTDYFGHLFLGKLLLAILYFGLTFASAYLLNYPSSVFYLILLLGINQFLVSMIFFIRANIAGMQWFRWDSIMSVLDRVVMIAVVGYLLFGSSLSSSFELMWFVYAQMGAYLLTIMFGIGVLLYKQQSIHFQFSRNTFLDALRKSWPYALIVLFMTIYHRTDAIMIERMLPNGAEESGYYAQSYRILEALHMFSILIIGVLYPMLSKMLSKREDISGIFDILLRLTAIFGAAIICLVVLGNQSILELLYSSTSESSSLIFFALVLSLIPMVIIDFYGTALTAGNLIGKYNLLSLISILINLVLNYLFIQSHGALGAAVTSLVTQFVTAIIVVFYSSRKFRIVYSKKMILSVIFLVLFTSITALYMQSTGLNTVLQFLISFLVIGVMTTALKIIDLKKLTRLL